MCVVDEMTVTETKLKALHGKKRKSTIEISDRDGLVASIGKSGKISWVYRYRFNGGHRRLVIGSYPALSIVEAREKLIPYSRELIDGHDPKHILTDKKIITLDDCTRPWLDLKVGQLRPATQTLYQSQIAKHINTGQFEHDVQRARFEYWLAYFDRIAKESSRVNSGAIFKTIRTILRWAKSRNIIQSSVLFDMDLKAVGESPSQGQRNLQLNEVGVLWNLINQSLGTPSLKACIKLLLIFGARNSEVRQAHVNEFDLHNMIWTLPATRSKTGKSIRRAIPELAKSIILEMNDIYGDRKIMIPGAHRGTSLTTHAVARFVTRIWAKMHVKYSSDKFIPHDFRRTLSTRLSEKGVMPHVTEKMLGHELAGIMATYNKHDWIDEQREAYALWSDMIKQAASTELSRL